VVKSAAEKLPFTWFQRRDDTEIEQSYQAVDQETGLVIRVRPDVLARGSKLVCGDIKGSRSPDRAGFRRDAYAKLYIVQAALYTDVLGLDEWWWIVIGNDGDECRTALYRCPDHLLELGRRAYSAGLDLLANARFEKRKEIPAWWEDRPMMLLDLDEEPPLWLVGEIMEFERHAQRMSRLEKVAE
jgi:hypothetical protein